MKMMLKINGVDFMPLIAKQGVKWQRNDIDAANSGRTMDGQMQRGRVATKIRLDITCRPLTAEEARLVLTTILPEYVSVDYYDPMRGYRSGISMYSNNNPASFLIEKPEDDWWSGITFPLIER
jgi:hypothetical protein|nr:MAG TPA: hypothetical protein [Caudoviricetes sp.]